MTPHEHAAMVEESLTPGLAPLRPCPKCGESGGLGYCPVCHGPRRSPSPEPTGGRPVLVNEDPEVTTLRRRVRVLEMALTEALTGLGNSTSLTMSAKHDLILKLSAIQHNPTSV